MEFPQASIVKPMKTESMSVITIISSIKLMMIAQLKLIQATITTKEYNWIGNIYLGGAFRKKISVTTQMSSAAASARAI